MTATAQHRLERDRDWLPDIEPDPYLSSGYRPGWLPQGHDHHVYPRTDLVWLDHHWALTTEGHKPARSWWREHGWNGDGLVPLAGVYLAAIVVGMAVLLIVG